MVAAAGDLRAAAAVVIDGPDAQADAWTAGQRPQVAHDGGGPERAAEVCEAWCEVGHLHDTVAPVVEARHPDGRIALLMTLRALKILQTAVIDGARTPQTAGERRGGRTCRRGE